MAAECENDGGDVCLQVCEKAAVCKKLPDDDYQRVFQPWGDDLRALWVQDVDLQVLQNQVVCWRVFQNRNADS